MPLIEPIDKQTLKLLTQTLPGIDRIVLLYQNKSEEKVSGEELTVVNNQYVSQIVSMDISIDKLLPKSRALNFIWLHPNEVPFEKSSKSAQPNLFDEAEYLVLNLIITVNKTEKKLYYLFFRNDLSNFGITNSNRGLDTFQKMFIGSTLSKIISQLYTNYSKTKDKIAKFTDVTKGLLERLDNSKQRDEVWNRDWIKDILSQNPLQPQGEWLIESSAIEAINSFQDYNSCKQALLNAAYLSSTLYNDEDDWPILSSFITDSSKDEPAKTTIDVKPQGRMARVELWLDSVEEAAALLISEGEEATGAAVGALLSPPVTAPAITDWLRKNQVRVNIALNKHNEKWPAIRTYFRPLMNIVKKNDINEKAG